MQKCLHVELLSSFVVKWLISQADKASVLSSAIAFLGEFIKTN
jgi:hypothetical protein